jgi:hypothetical protein
MRKLQYRLILEPGTMHYQIMNGFATQYGDASRPSIKITSQKGLTREKFSLDESFDEYEDDIMRIMNGEHPDWVLGSIRLFCQRLVFYFLRLDEKGDTDDGGIALSLVEFEGVEFTCEVERDDGFPADHYLVKGINDNRSYRNPDSKLSKYRPRVTEWDGIKKREITIVRELAKLSYEKNDFWLNVTEYC